MQHGLETVHCTGDPWELQDLPAKDHKKDCLLFTKRKKKYEKEWFHSFTIVVKLRKNRKVIKIMKKFVYNKQVWIFQWEIEGNAFPGNLSSNSGPGYAVQDKKKQELVLPGHSQPSSIP